MFIQTEDTPNQNTLKFIPEKTVLDSTIGSLQYKKGDDTSSSPLAERILQIEGVEAVLLGSDFISVTKHNDFDWYILKPSILGVIVENFVNGISVYKGDSSNSSEKEFSDSISKQIHEIINDRVRPSVAMDGGDIKFEYFENGIVYVSMHGACSGCPSSTATLKSGIENMLRYYVPEVEEVRQFEGN